MKLTLAVMITVVYGLLHIAALSSETKVRLILWRTMDKKDMSKDMLIDQTRDPILCANAVTFLLWINET